MKTFVIFWSIAALCKGYLIDVSPQREDCFYEHVKTKRTAFLGIAVLDDVNCYLLCHIVSEIHS